MPIFEISGLSDEFEVYTSTIEAPSRDHLELLQLEYLEGTCFKEAYFDWAVEVEDPDLMDHEVLPAKRWQELVDGYGHLLGLSPT